MEAPTAGGMVTPIAAYESDIYSSKRAREGWRVKGVLGVLGFDLGLIPSHAREAMAAKMEHIACRCRKMDYKWNSD